MSATRTQVYLTAEQRAEIERLRNRDGRTLAAIVRDALDAYLDEHRVDRREALERTFGAAPDLEVPSRDEWDRGRQPG